MFAGSCHVHRLLLSVFHVFLCFHCAPSVFHFCSSCLHIIFFSFSSCVETRQSLHSCLYFSLNSFSRLPLLPTCCPSLIAMFSPHLPEVPFRPVWPSQHIASLLPFPLFSFFFSRHNSIYFYLLFFLSLIASFFLFA